MTVSFYDVSIASFLQGLAGVVDFLEKAQTHAAGSGLDLEGVVDSRLYPDMKPFRFQIQSVAHHSLGALAGLRSGTFSPPPPIPDYSYGELQALIVEAQKTVGEATREEVERLAEGNVMFVAGDRRIPFTAVNFILSFSLPNFYFHAATAYDMLRMRGVPFEKRDYLGRLRFEKTPKPA